MNHFHRAGDHIIFFFTFGSSSKYSGSSAGLGTISRCSNCWKNHSGRCWFSRKPSQAHCF
ncbi:hypothetical protein AXF42_Ash013929 [Apostasia shenzhenica]|uniref:Uncharacterized protein n=1 Tax=Apostasia shenzhenica TaxID=1088818 RepID=A0A2I0AS97_9ASPA|nr:hypothetical protein AXF42_Ash013929 [Apostasia shenzhenica]